MEPESLDKSMQREINAKRKLWPDYVSLGNWRFMNIDNGKVRDLSAADLNQIERIEREDLFAC